MSAPTPEQRAEWRADAKYQGIRPRAEEVVDALDALDAAEAERDELGALRLADAEKRVILRQEWAKEHARAEQAERELCLCRAKHPTNPTVVSCRLDRQHKGDHWSSTGCAGSVVTWPNAEAEVARLAATVERVEALADDLGRDSIHATALATGDAWGRMSGMAFALQDAADRIRAAIGDER